VLGINPEEAIIFIGQAYSGDSKLAEDYYITCSDSSASGLTFKINSVPTEDITI